VVISATLRSYFVRSWNLISIFPCQVSSQDPTEASFLLQDKGSLCTHFKVGGISVGSVDFVPVVLVVLQDFPERRVVEVSAIPKVPHLPSNLFMRIFVPLVRGHACQHMVHSDVVLLYHLGGMICAVLGIMLSIFFWVASYQRSLQWCNPARRLQPEEASAHIPGSLLTCHVLVTYHVWNQVVGDACVKRNDPEPERGKGNG
jgi:hypothetical protein